MKIVYFTHSLISCWNHGNAHFLRGVMRALVADGHDVRLYEPEQSWSRENLLAEGGEAAREGFAETFPTLAPRVSIMRDDAESLDAALDGADIVVVHEWNEPPLVAAVGQRRLRNAGFALLFHDTHHRMVSDPQAMARYDLSAYDGVLAFGETLSEAYRRHGWGDRVFTWHEAADTALFHPPSQPVQRAGAVWIGNWGDGERSAELHDYMLSPVSALQVPLDIYGVRYPREVEVELVRRGVHYHGWAPNARAPEIFARHLLTLHVPRRFYVTQLRGIPTIRVFEALACGIPLLSAPWEDSESLFSPGRDFLQARTPKEMQSLMQDLLHDRTLRESLAAQGWRTIQDRHSCVHRAQQLLGIVEQLRDASAQEAA
ncbi:MAG: glycosyltransferase [Proteobacteria bacterium]|nr:glycosyltransferase [Pseudomonadota bacterium]